MSVEVFVLGFMWIVLAIEIVRFANSWLQNDTKTMEREIMLERRRMYERKKRQ